MRATVPRMPTRAAPRSAVLAVLTVLALVVVTELPRALALAAILAAAMHEFAQKGYGGARIDEIAGAPNCWNKRRRVPAPS